MKAVHRVVNKSNSGATAFVDKIFFTVTTPKTYASYVLLKDFYTQLDDTNLKSFVGRMKMIGFSRKTLTTIKKKTGCLVCSYCTRPDLIIELNGMRVPNNIKATIDHVVPTSKGGAPFDVKNIRVACGKCNGRKGNMSVEEFIKIVKPYKA